MPAEIETPKRQIDELNAIKLGSVAGSAELRYAGINAPAVVIDGVKTFGYIGQMNTELYATEGKYAEDQAIFETSTGVIAEAAAYRMSLTNLVKSARKIHMAGTDQVLWSERFRDASEEIYGEPSREVALPIALKLLEGIGSFSFEGGELSEMQSVTMSRLAVLISETSVEDGQHAQIDLLDTLCDDARELGGYLNERFAYEFEGIKDERVYEPTEQVELLLMAVAKRSEADNKWSKVQVRFDDKAGNFSVSSRDPENIYLNVGLQRASATGLEMKGLIGHEVFWHLERGLNGWERGDPIAATGFPGYESFEEGGGVFSEIGITGKVPTKHSDRYLDIAIALGKLDGVEWSRKELNDLVTARNILRAASETGEISQEQVEAESKKSKIHTDRMYRGGLGDESEAGRKGVFTKDIIYLDGVFLMQQYLKDRKAEGVPISAVYDYMTQGKFVALNPSHTEYMESKHGVVLVA
jgi:hypothetical protein